MTVYFGSVCSIVAAQNKLFLQYTIIHILTLDEEHTLDVRKYFSGLVIVVYHLQVVSSTDLIQKGTWSFLDNIEARVLRLHATN